VNAGCWMLDAGCWKCPAEPLNRRTAEPQNFFPTAKLQNFLFPQNFRGDREIGIVPDHIKSLVNIPALAFPGKPVGS
jgi:hypothetical protein